MEKGKKWEDYNKEPGPGNRGYHNPEQRFV